MLKKPSPSFTELANSRGPRIDAALAARTDLGKGCPMRLRDYDATMCGLCHLAARLPELERGFDEGREILYYDDVAEIPGLLAKIRRDAIPWRDIGKNARIRAETEHTWTKRLGAALG